MTPFVGDANAQTPEFKAFLVNVERTATCRPNLSSPDESAAPPGQSCATAVGSVDRD
jgi:hypothetical protein